VVKKNPKATSNKGEEIMKKQLEKAKAKGGSEEESPEDEDSDEEDPAK